MRRTNSESKRKTIKIQYYKRKDNSQYIVEALLFEFEMSRNGLPTVEQQQHPF